jgi:hypothetical protein
MVAVAGVALSGGHERVACWSSEKEQDTAVFPVQVSYREFLDAKKEFELVVDYGR